MKIAATTVDDIAGQNVKTTQKFHAGVVDREKLVQVMKDMRLNPESNIKDEKPISED
jgi:hypothetical protein